MDDRVSVRRYVAPIDLTNDGDDMIVDDEAPPAEPAPVRPVMEVSEEDAKQCGLWEITLRSTEPDIDLQLVRLVQNSDLNWPAFQTKVRLHLSDLMPALVGTGSRRHNDRFYGILRALVTLIVTAVQRISPTGFPGQRSLLDSRDWLTKQARMTVLEYLGPEPPDHPLEVINRVYAAGPDLMSSVSLQNLLMGGALIRVNRLETDDEAAIMAAIDQQMYLITTRFLLGTLIYDDVTMRLRHEEDLIDYSEVLSVRADVPRHQQQETSERITLAFPQTRRRVFAYFSNLLLIGIFRLPNAFRR